MQLARTELVVVFVVLFLGIAFGQPTPKDSCPNVFITQVPSGAVQNTDRLDTDACELFRFDMPETIGDNDNLVITVTTISGSVPYILLTRNYPNENDLDYDYRFDPSVIQTFTVPRCALQPLQKWYLAFISDAENTRMSASWNLVSDPSFAPQQIDASTGQGSVSGTLVLGSWLYYVSSPASPNAQRIDIDWTPDNVAADIRVLWGSCPTGRNVSAAFESTRVNKQLGRAVFSTAPNQQLYIGVYTSTNTSGDFTMTISLDPDWACRKPEKKLHYCEKVDYRIQRWQEAEAIDDYLDNHWFGNLKGSCVVAILEYMCSRFFPPCKSNNFPEPICTSICGELQDKCDDWPVLTSQPWLGVADMVDQCVGDAYTASKCYAYNAAMAVVPSAVFATLLSVVAAVLVFF